MHDIILFNLLEARKCLDEFLNNPDVPVKISAAAALMCQAIDSGNKIISCGNGGSMCDAMHFAEELTGRFRDNRAAIPAISISDPAYITCTMNDYGQEYIFSRFIQGLGMKNDVLLAISTSGNSKNVINAAIMARERGMKVVALTGKNGGELAKHCDVEIRAPGSKYADRAQELHIKIIHCFIDLIEKQLFT
jgi:D-sedoheptulose 7-phosphate isomerase